MTEFFEDELKIANNTSRFKSKFLKRIKSASKTLLRKCEHGR